MAQKKRSKSKSALEQHVPQWLAYAVLIILFLVAVKFVKNAGGLGGY